MLSDAIPFETLRRALVIKLRHHGDVLLAAPVLSVLKHAAPQCEIDALVYEETRPMLANHPALAELHGIDRGWKQQGVVAQARAEWALLSKLRSRRYDIIIHLTEHRRGAWIARLTGARWTVGPQRSGRFWRKSFSHRYAKPLNARRHTVERNLDALRRIGLQPAPGERAVALVPGRAADTRCQALLAEYKLPAQGFALLHMASRWHFKCWPAAHAAVLADALQARGLPVVLTAAPDPAETALIADILKAAGTPLIDLSGRLGLLELAALAGQARLFVGVDSAPMHIAAAMGTPVVALFGPSGDQEWGPWQVPHRIVASTRHPCRPCGIDGCGGGKVSDCLATLPVAQALAACEELLGLAPPTNETIGIGRNHE